MSDRTGGTETTNRTVVVGFDALDFEYLDRFADSLPNFQAVREAGVEAPLRSTFPPWTGSAWPSMYTGTDPSHHGVYGFFHHGDGYPDDDELVSRNHVDQPAIWNYLTAEGDPAVVLNVPVTHPAEPIEGTLVPGYLANEDDSGHPEGVRDDISDAIGEEYTIYSSGETSDDKRKKRRGYLDLIEQRGRAAEHLLTERGWQVAVVQVQKTDAVFHNFDDPAAFRAVYERADDLLGRVRDAAGDANVVVCSDHGMGRVDGYTVYVNEVLRDAGLVEATSDADGPSLAHEKAALTGDGNSAAAGDDSSDSDSASLANRAVSAATTALGAVGLTPGDAYQVARKAGVADVLTGALPDDAISQASEDVDYRASAAYCRSAELGVRVNLAGREPSGVVAPDDYEQVRDRIVAALSNLRTPDGDPAFEWVRRREAVYDGPHAEEACDVLFCPADMDHVLSPNLVGEQFLPVADHDHDRDGVLLATGPDIDSAVDPDRRSLTDVAPLALAAAGYDVPERMTGAVPDGVLDRPTSRRNYGDVPFGPDLADETAGDDPADDERDDAAVEERLSDLGYI